MAYEAVLTVDYGKLYKGSFESKHEDHIKSFEVECSGHRVSI